MISAQNVFLKFGDRVLFDEINFVVNDSDKVGLVGRNGAGKSTLLRMLAKQQTPDGGVLDFPNGRSIGFLTQDIPVSEDVSVMEECLSAFSEMQEIQDKIEHLNQEMITRTDYESDSYAKLINNFTDLSERFNLLGGDNFKGETEKVLKGLGFKDTEFEKRLNELSGGWRMRVELAKLLLQKPDYLLLDEPTNHLDIVSKDILKKALIAYDGALIVVSHDRDFLQGLTERTIEFRDRKLHEYLGDVQYFLEKRQVDNFRDVSLGKNANGTNSPKTVPSQTNVTELSPEQKKEQHNRKKQLQRDLHNAERKVEKLEKKIVEYEAKMAESGFYESEKSQETLQAYQKTQEDLEAAMGHWETTQEEFDSL